MLNCMFNAFLIYSMPMYILETIHCNVTADKIIIYFFYKSYIMAFNKKKLPLIPISHHGSFIIGFYKESCLYIHTGEAVSSGNQFHYSHYLK